MTIDESTFSALRGKVNELMTQAVREIQDLVRTESVSGDPARMEELSRSAQQVSDLLESVGVQCEITSVGGSPAVIGFKGGPKDAPTVLLYAHHDVQPTGADSDWETAPFVTEERAGRLYGRGTADNKGGIAAHLVTLRAFEERLPVNVVVVIEGDEELGSPGAQALLDAYGERLQADVVLVPDSVNASVDEPAFTTTLRGLVGLQVTVKSAERALHSGLYGGPVPDAMLGLVHLLSTLHDGDGRVTIDGLQIQPKGDFALDEAAFREEAGLLPGVELIGEGSLASRLWELPAVTVTGVDVPSIENASNTLLPEASAKLSVRIGPQQSPEEVARAVTQHLISHAPWGVTVQVELLEAGSGFAADTHSATMAAAKSAFHAAWGCDAAEIGIGGSIPFVSAYSEKFPASETLIFAIQDPGSQAHGPNESIDLQTFNKACLSQVLLLADYSQEGGV
ncbi:MAG TPA: M20/M25/M40 family metallo-hydrolase [Actinomycetales bacterium]|nr:M20/M25/M40 family metallo-hydrolase [Actinomycetales bacterium]